MDLPGWLLTIWALGSLLFLAGVEAYCAINHLPLISDRVAALGGHASIVVILSSVTIGYLLAHFWDGYAANRKGKQ